MSRRTNPVFSRVAFTSSSLRIFLLDDLSARKTRILRLRFDEPRKDVGDKPKCFQVKRRNSCASTGLAKYLETAAGQYLKEEEEAEGREGVI